MAAARAVVAGFAASFDPDLVSAAEALRIAEDATAVVNMAETIKALAFARAAETSLTSEEGDRSAAHNMARKSGTSVGKAKDASLGELKDECARTKARRDAEDPEARHKRIRAPATSAGAPPPMEPASSTGVPPSMSSPRSGR